MGIITKIEEKLGDIVENPFRSKDGLDLSDIEICLKRLIEIKRKNILGNIFIPNIMTIIIDKEKFEKYELFLEGIKKTLEKSLHDWIKEKGYELPEKMELNFKGDLLKNKMYEIHVSYKNRKKANPLKFVAGELINIRTNEAFKVNHTFLILGRAEDCEIRINDPTISRKHASLSYQNGKVILEDLESKSGTWVNHQKITKQILRQGDRIMIGSSELTFLDPWRSSWKLKDDAPHNTARQET